MKFTKRALAAVLSAAMMTCAFAGCGDTAASASAASSQAAASNAAATGDKVVKIGVYEPASGDNGAGGKQETLGVQYANKVQPTVEINGETYTVQLDIVDNQSSTDKGPSAAQQLVSDGVSVVLGSYGSAVAIAAGDVFKNGKVPAIGITCTNPQVTEGNDYYYRICFLDPFQEANTIVVVEFASWIRSRAPYLQTLLSAISRQRRHTACPSRAMTTPQVSATTSSRPSRPWAARL